MPIVESRKSRRMVHRDRVGDIIQASSSRNGRRPLTRLASPKGAAGLLYPFVGMDPKTDLCPILSPEKDLSAHFLVPARDPDHS